MGPRTTSEGPLDVKKMMEATKLEMEYYKTYNVFDEVFIGCAT